MIIGYGFYYDNENYVNYEVGKTYTFHGDFVKHNRGFNFYTSLENLFSENNVNNAVHVFEFEVWGEIVKFRSHYVTNEIKVVRQISISERKKYDLKPIYPVCKYDENGNLINRKDSRGYEEWFEYDLNGNCIRECDNNGYECKKEYNSNGMMIHFSDNEGSEVCYNDSSLITYMREKSGFEVWNKYDSFNNTISHKNSDGFEECREYDETGEKIMSVSNSFGFHKKFDFFGNLIYSKDNTGYEEWFEYDSKNNHIGYKNGDNENWKIVIKES